MLTVAWRSQAGEPEPARRELLFLVLLVGAAHAYPVGHSYLP
jgi:hypothetical protein